MRDNPSDTSHPEQAVETFLAALAAAQRRLERTGAREADVALALAVALLRYRRCCAGNRMPPAQVVVAGPTQAGKSTAVNWLFGRAVAEASPLAGYTRHAQGFASSPLTDETLTGLACVFGDATRVPCAELRAHDAAAWCADTVAGAAVFEQPAVIWDSPDFDSVNSRRYRATAFHLFALADVVLFMVSKEKYADQTVWTTLELLKPLAIPTLICVNKLPAAARAALLGSLQERLRDAGIDARVLSVPYAHDLQPGDAPALQQAVREALSAPRHAPCDRDIRPFLQQHWDAWCEPVRAEYRQSAHWRECVDAAVEAAADAYEAQYLAAPHYAATLQQAMVRLLELLEIPGLAEPLVKARRLLTWPARKLHGLISAATGRAITARPDRERDILAGILRQTLTDLQQQAAHLSGRSPEPAAHWWQQLFSALYQQGAELDRRSRAAIQSYQTAFAVEVDAAAQQLFTHLKRHPAMLNSLRAARVTADAAGLVIALKTGGVGLNDLILTPAMLSFTSTLTEGAIGGYMHTVESGLKARQRQAVRETLLDGALKQTLLEAPHAMSAEDLLSIDEALYRAAEQAMAR